MWGGGGGGASLKEDFEITFLYIYIYANFEGVGGLACDRCQKGAIPLHWSLFTSAFTAANEGHKIVLAVEKAWAQCRLNNCFFRFPVSAAGL